MKKLTTILILLCLTFTTYSQNTPSNVSRIGLTGWWPFNGNANDLSGNGNNGIVSGPTLTNDRHSLSNSAYYFDGSNDFVNLGNNSLLPKTAITISIWFKTNYSGGDQELFSSDQSWSTYTLRLRSNGTPYWRIHPRTSGGAGMQLLNPQGTSYSDNNWHHFVGTWSGTTMELYIDGVSVASGSMTTTPVAFNSGNALIGKFPSGVQHFKGNLDDIGIWSRALSSQEIIRLYNRCTASLSLSLDTVKSCGVDSLQLDAGTGWKSYVWSNNNTSQQTYVSNSGMYRVTVADTTNGCIGKDSVYVSLIKAQITQVDTAICKGDTLEVGNLQTNQYSYLWSTNDTTSSIKVSPSQTTHYHVTTSDGVGSCKDSITIAVSEPIVNATVVDTASCANLTDGSLTATVSNGLPPYSYKWSNGDSLASSSGIGVGKYNVTVTDSIGCIALDTISMTYSDSVKPTVIIQNLTVYLDTNGTSLITTAQVNDSSTDNCGLDTMYLSNYSFSCSDIGSNTVILTVKDVNGNTSSSNATITVLDTISPKAIAQNITVYLDTNGTASITAAKANNGSSDNCQVGLTLSKSIITCEDEGNLVLALIANDSSGNTSIDSFSVQVIDTNFTVAGILGDSVSAQGNINTYSVSSVNDATYQWSAVNGISVASGSSSDITWSKDSVQGEVQVIQTVKEGCKDTSTMLVTLWVTGIKDIQLIENINLFPNPTRGRVFVSVDRGEINNATILVYSRLGQLVVSLGAVQINDSAFELDLRHLPSGQYTVVISSGEKSNRYGMILH